MLMWLCLATAEDEAVLLPCFLNQTQLISIIQSNNNIILSYDHMLLRLKIKSLRFIGTWTTANRKKLVNSGNFIFSWVLAFILSFCTSVCMICFVFNSAIILSFVFAHCRKTFSLKLMQLSLSIMSLNLPICKYICSARR